MRQLVWVQALSFVFPVTKIAALSMAVAAFYSSPQAMAANDSTPLAASADEAETAAIHGQVTLVEQGHFAFHAPYGGPNSLDSGNVGRETLDLTLFAGVRPWSGAEVWINPEIDQGFGLSDTLGVAGFPSGEAYKVGKNDPYFRLQRVFLRQTFNLGEADDYVGGVANQLGGYRSVDRLVVTVGKLSVPDIFDVSQHAHDARGDFLNWSVLDVGSFDYAADAWGYTAGVAAEWYQGRWTWRGGVFDLSNVPNSEKLDSQFKQHQIDLEVENRFDLAGKPGKVLVTAFQSHGRMGRFDDAVRLAQSTGSPADIAAVRHVRNRAGLSFRVEQQVSSAVGVFIHGGVANGDIEPYEFSDIDRTIAAGLSVNGVNWHREQDRLGLVAIVNEISTMHQRFLDAGGQGILVGDGQLPHPGPEVIVETYYDFHPLESLHLSADYQFVDHPAYNKDRGPVSLVGVRIHSQF